MQFGVGSRQDDDDEDEDDADTWVYDAQAKVYRRRSGGAGLAVATLVGMRDYFNDAQAAHADQLAADLAAGDLTIQAWQDEMRTMVRDGHLANYALGRGGQHSMEDGDLEDTGKLVKPQWQWLRDFAVDIAAGKLTLAAIQARARQYANAPVQANAMGTAAQYGSTLSLPGYPGDGETECMAMCRCAWGVQEFDDRWEATWFDVGDKRECNGCTARATDWAPWIQRK